MNTNLARLPDFTPAQIMTIRQTVAKEANDIEFDLFLGMAREYGLNPFKKQLHIIIYNKDNPEKRSHAIFPSRDGFRILAARQSDYRPAEGPAQFVIDESAKDPERNPLGIVSCGITLFKKDPSSGDWHPIYGECYWDEFAKVQEEWDWQDCDDGKRRRKPTGKFELTGGWKTMPRLMIQKCSESQALRSGWPDVFGGLYNIEEMRMPGERLMKDITPDSELSPSQKVAKEAIHQRQNRLGDRAIMMVLDTTGVLQRVPIGEVYDRSMEFMNDATAEEIHRWAITNSVSLQEYWAVAPGDALELKKEIEKATEKIGEIDHERTREGH